MTAPRHTLIKYAGPPLPRVGSRFTHLHNPNWSMVVVGMYPRGGMMRIVIQWANGEERHLPEDLFRATFMNPLIDGWEFQDMKEFTVP